MKNRVHNYSIRSMPNKAGHTKNAVAHDIGARTKDIGNDTYFFNTDCQYAACVHLKICNK